MAKFKQLVDHDLNKNQVLNMVLHTLTSHPSSPREGQMYFNSVDNAAYVYLPNSTAQGLPADGWVDISHIHRTDLSRSISTASGDASTKAKVLGSITVNSEGHVTSVSTRDLTLEDLGYTGDPDANKYEHPTEDTADSIVYADGTWNEPTSGSLTTISKITFDNGHLKQITSRELTKDEVGALVIDDSQTKDTAGTTNTTRTWSAKKLDELFTQLNNNMIGALVFVGGYNASANDPDLTSTTAIETIEKGHTYVVTGADSTFHGEPVQAGDMIIATKPKPETAADWTIVNKNIEEILNATEAEAGTIEIATQNETNAGNDDSRAITPKKLLQFIKNRGYNNTNSTTGTSFDFNHGLNSESIHISVYDEDSSSDTYKQEVGVSKQIVDNNIVRIKVNESRDVNTLRVIVKKVDYYNTTN